MAENFAASVTGLSALAEPLRRRLYLYVVSQPEPVSRDQAAEAAGLARHTAKFHLDRLVDEGLLDTEFRRLSGRDGPGAGRPAKLYRRSALELAVSVPERRYDLAGEVLAQAVDEAVTDRIPVLEAVRRVAAETGRALGAAATGERGSRAPATGVAALAEVLDSCGFEPRVEGDRVTLANCPFHSLARKHTGLVCGMNLELVTGMLEGLGCSAVVAQLEPDPRRCCVTTSARAERLQPS